MPWADEYPNSAPDPKREPFYLLIAMHLGDPRTRDWIKDNAIKFHRMFSEFYEVSYPAQGSTDAMIQYLLWYERDGPKEL